MMSNFWGQKWWTMFFNTIFGLHDQSDQANHHKVYWICKKIDTERYSTIFWFRPTNLPCYFTSNVKPTSYYYIGILNDIKQQIGLNSFCRGYCSIWHQSYMFENVDKIRLKFTTRGYRNSRSPSFKCNVRVNLAEQCPLW